MTSFYEELHKSNSFSDEKENKQSRASVDKWIFRLLVFLVGVTPLIVMAHAEQVISPLVSQVDILMSGTKGDLFTHFKALFVLIITCIIATLFLAKIFFMGGTIRKIFLNYILGIFAIILILSTITSPNISVALNGLYNRSDGAISWLCYVVLIFVAMNVEYPKKSLNYVIYAMIPFVFINLIIITMNFYSKDLLQYTWVQKTVSITLPEGASIGGGSQLVGTLNQWNYMSGMFAIMAVMYLTWAIISKKWYEALIGIVTAVASTAIIFMSISTSGFLTVCIALILVLLVALKSKNMKRGLTLLVIFLLASVPIFHILANKDARVWAESIGFILQSNPYENKEGNMSINSNNILNSGNMGFYRITKAYAAEKLELPELPERGVSFGSGRGYIWSETLQLIKERPLFGYGNDTLIYNFPHYQIESRAELWDEQTIVDKPHNVYLGVLYGNGILGFMAFIIILVYSAVVFIKKMIKENENNILVYTLGVAIFAYAVQAMFNDSLPGVTVVAFVFLGMLLAIENNDNEYI